MDQLTSILRLTQLLDGGYVAVDSEVLAVDNLGVQMTPATGACFAVIQVQGDDIRYWESGVTTSPTGTDGILLSNKDVVIIKNEANIATTVFILDGASAASDLHIQYYKRNW